MHEQIERCIVCEKKFNVYGGYFTCKFDCDADMCLKCGPELYEASNQCKIAISIEERVPMTHCERVIYNQVGFDKLTDKTK